MENHNIMFGQKQQGQNSENIEKMPVGMLFLIVWNCLLAVLVLRDSGEPRFLVPLLLVGISSTLNSIVLACLAAVAVYTIIKRFKWGWKYIIAVALLKVIFDLVSLIYIFLNENKYYDLIIKSKTVRISHEAFKYGKLVLVIVGAVIALVISSYVYRKRRYFVK